MEVERLHHQLIMDRMEAPLRVGKRLAEVRQRQLQPAMRATTGLPRAAQVQDTLLEECSRQDLVRAAALEVGQVDIINPWQAAAAVAWVSSTSTDILSAPVYRIPLQATCLDHMPPRPVI